MRLVLALCAITVAALAVVPAATTGPTRRAPVIKYQDDQFGAILATRGKKALYYWTVEKRAGGKIRCRGHCARAWPPLIVKTRRVDLRIPGIRGKFGTIRRPDGRYQVTFKGLPVYSYVNEGPEQVLCDDVDGWFVVRLR
jgi:predicted lipoprotein with Yx(FWY)xxD motif